MSLIISNFYYNSLLAYQQRQREQRLGYHCLTLWDQHSQFKWLYFLANAAAAAGSDEDIYYKTIFLSRYFLVFEKPGNFCETGFLMFIALE
ncbi:hypothetical protein [Microseira wollei]|uniref:hypothetical protein n=1 Tax=Microseira wollei TaxID=467598 RepID=UPI001CFC6B9E|nr:hypothetical protein [Microseira wollei]